MKKFILPLFALLYIACSTDSSDNPTPPAEAEKFTLKVTAGNGGTVSSSGGTYGKGTEVTLTATAEAEYLFDKWSNGATENPLKIVVNSNINLTANFLIKKYALTIEIEGEGEVEEEIVSSGKSTDYDSGTTVRLTAEPMDEWTFVGWSGAVDSSENPIELTLTEEKQLTAEFVPAQYTLVIDSGEGGQVDSSGGEYDYGTELVVTATPDNDFIFSHWSDDSEENPRTITIDSNKELTALFKDKFEIENGFYILVGVVDDNGNPIFYDAPPFVFEYANNETIFTGTVYEDLASFPVFKDIGYVPGAGDPDENLINEYISRFVIHRQYNSGGARHSWLLKKIEESEIPHKKSHEEIMELVAGKGFWSDPIYAEIDPLVPETYVTAFIKDAERHGLDLSFVDLDKVLVEFRDEGFAGLSHLSCIDDDRVHISYYTPFWNSASYFDIQNERLTVMYHELGHDILNSGHPATGDMKQFMNQALGDVGPIVWDDSDPMFSFRRMVDDMFSGVGLDYPCTNGATDYSSGAAGKSGGLGKGPEHCFTYPFPHSEIHNH
ncbi:InlB B-repeat-containing protein [Flagellimonas algicola]|uniref:Bacterial repeat domain-containing protein n=1 Tax=Flagellimonas algicola TaxID=2583815 RepID=A0ABY2WPD6_9FLAO|nr:hypothetical protein [Allomuricauda algicola]TMU56854.1 hypothetical protein FGG15_04725 [Allomuricauda algicola]